MNRKVVIFAVLLLLLLAPAAAAWSWNPATWISRAFKIGDGKDIDMNQRGVGNGFAWNITCGGNCTGFDHTPTVNTTGYDLTNASNLTKGGFDIAGTADITHATGAGTRLMWIPAKAAFRAGHVDGTAWDPGSVGTNSFASGQNTIASGTASTAIGDWTVASGDYSFATGTSATASNSATFASGQNTIASGLYSTAMGGSTTASNQYTTATGKSTTASGLYSTAMGYNAIAGGQNSFAIGLSTATHPSIAANTLGISGGTVNITDAGKGITLASPSGYRNCITVNDNGTLNITTNTTCT